MKNFSENNLKKIILSILFSVIILFVIFYRDIYEIFGYKISPILLLGFIIVGLDFLLFINLNHKRTYFKFVEVKFISENSIIFILLILMCISLFIPVKNSANMIISPDKISFLNYFRACVYMIGCAFIPGSLIYRFIFKNGILLSKFNINPFIIKITLYPLISLGFIGTFILIFDQINLSSELFSALLVSLILILFLLELVKEKKTNNRFDIKFIKINISNYSLIIFLLAFGVAVISIGFQIGNNFLVSGDPWDGIKYANYVGDIEGSPLYINSYPNFWGYIIFGLSVLGGLPFINMNTLLAPFSYLFITSIYLLIKSLLYHFKIKFVVLSTILMSIFAGILINPLVPSLIFVGEYYFIYKTFSYCLLFVSMAIFIVIMRRSHTIGSYVEISGKNEELKFISLSSIFLVLSFITYIYPLILGIILLSFHCLFSKKNRKNLNFRYYKYFLVFLFLFLILFDVLMNFYLSYVILEQFIYFFNYEFVRNVIHFIPRPLLTYSLLLVVLLTTLIINWVFLKVLNNQKIRKIILKLNFKKIFKIFLILIAIFIAIEFSFIFLEIFIPNIDFSKQLFFFLFLDKIFLNLGVIGIIGISVSYYCWKRDKLLFLTLVFWILTSFILAFIIPFIEFFKNIPFSPEKFSEQEILIMDYWFNRLWVYSIPSLCIFASIGLFEIFKKLKQYKFLNKFKISPVLSKNIIVLLLIIFSFSGIIYTGVLNSDANFRYTDNQIDTLDWISENIPIHSGVVVGDNFFMGVGTESIAFVRQYFFYDIFEEAFNQTKCIEQIEYLKNETIQYAVISQFFISYYLNKWDFTNNTLIPRFYNITLYQNGDLSVYYAPYFD